MGSRQNLPVQDLPVATKHEGALKGGYVLVKESGKLERILLAAGSEVWVAVEAAKELGPGTRVVSMPCVEAFERQSAEYREEVLPKAMREQTTACEAGVTSAWYKYAGKVLGVDDFGESAPGDQVFEAKGVSLMRFYLLLAANSCRRLLNSAAMRSVISLPLCSGHAFTRIQKHIF